MTEPVDPSRRQELLELYSELHLVCGRAAAALRLAGKWDAPEDELLRRFRENEALASEIWARIVALGDEKTP